MIPGYEELHRAVKELLADEVCDRRGAPITTLIGARAEIADRHGCGTWDALIDRVRVRDGVPPPIPVRQLDLLRDLSTHEQGHSAGTLFDHLIATHDLLACWGNSSDVCGAGLFHSIYGTEYYTVQSAGVDQRVMVAEVVGERAEQLAHAFCVTDRTSFFPLLGVDEPVLEVRATGSALPVDAAAIVELAEIEVANVVEQVHPRFHGPDRVDALRRMASLGASHLSAGASASLAELIARCR